MGEITRQITRTVTGPVEMVVCDSCGKEVAREMPKRSPKFDSMDSLDVPWDWFRIKAVRFYDQGGELGAPYDFCSPACIAAWANAGAPRNAVRAPVSPADAAATRREEGDAP